MEADLILVETPEGPYLLSNVIGGIISKDPAFDELRKRYSWDDIGSGNLFADCYKSNARYVAERGKWYRFYTGRWEPDSGFVMELCKELGTALMRFWMKTNNDDEAKNFEQFKKFAFRWSKRSVRETILKDAASVYPVSVSDFDCNPYLLNCLNGTLDLQTMTFRSHDSEDFLTMMTNVRYNPNARCQRWEQHIREIMCDDAEMIAYLQKALGYALTGTTAYEAFMILFGPTSRNGKGVTMSTYTKMIGDYGCTANPETITQKLTVNGSAPSEDIARLAGKRFVNISEPDKNLVLSSALVKTLTGNDKITARFLHENSFEFFPKFKIFINTNYLPKVTDSTIFSSGRVKVLMFNRHFEPHEQDKGLKAELSKPENLSGILNWCIEGWQMLQATGFDEPQAVIDAVEAYREDSDKVGLFLKERMLADPNGEASMTDTYNEYRDWCYDNGYKVESMTSFKKSLVGRATIKRKRLTGMGRSANPISVICGYNLLAPVQVFASGKNFPEGEQKPEGES